MTAQRQVRDYHLMWLLRVTGPTYAVIPVDQIMLDPHQPRKTIKETALRELAESIRNEGLQQPIIVNPAFARDKKGYFYVDKGERRWRAHKLLRLERIACLVEPKAYDGKLDIDRKLKQGSENFCREPQTHAEIVALVAEAVEATIAESGVRGAVGIACKRVAVAFGQNIDWAQKYHRLARLHPELLAMLDSEDEEQRLGLLDAYRLAVAPLEEQKGILEKALTRKERGGHAAVRKFIAETARSLREAGGEKLRGRRPSDEKEDLCRFVRILATKSNNFIGERHSGEYAKYLSGVINSLGTIEVDELIRQLAPVEVATHQILEVLQARRKVLYEPFSVSGRES